MAKRTSKKSPGKPIKRLASTQNFFLVVAVLFGMMAGVLMVKVFYSGEVVEAAPNVVQLGAMEYDFSSGKAIKKQTPATKSLRTFLQKQAETACGYGKDHYMGPSYFIVKAFTSNQKQVLLGYGCNSADANMFAVQKEGEWQLISPTNQFDPLTGAPQCSHVAKYGISKEIAPVCFTVHGERAHYQVR